MAATFEQYRAKLDKALYEKNAFTDVLQTIEDKTGVKRIYVVGGAIGVVALWLIFGYAAAFLSTFLGFVYPAYMSVKAIESERKDDDTQWLTYWVVFGVFSLGEFFTDIFLSWFPFYYLFKMIFLGWCMAPIESNGANLLYHRFIKPFVLKHEKEIDDSLGKVTDIASSTLNEGEDDGMHFDRESAAMNGDSDTSSSSDYNAGFFEVEQEPLDENLLSNSKGNSDGWGSLSYSSNCVKSGLSDGTSNNIKEEPPPTNGGGINVLSVEVSQERVSNVSNADTQYLSGKTLESQECNIIGVDDVAALPPQCAPKSQEDAEEAVTDANRGVGDDTCVDDGYTSSDEGDPIHPDMSPEVAFTSGELDIQLSPPGTLGGPAGVEEPNNRISYSAEVGQESVHVHVEHSNTDRSKDSITGFKHELESGRVDNYDESKKTGRETECDSIQEEMGSQENGKGEETKGILDCTKGEDKDLGLSHDKMGEGIDQGNECEKRDGVDIANDENRTEIRTGENREKRNSSLDSCGVVKARRNVEDCVNVDESMEVYNSKEERRSVHEDGSFKKVMDVDDSHCAAESGNIGGGENAKVGRVGDDADNKGTERNVLEGCDVDDDGGETETMDKGGNFKEARWADDVEDIDKYRGEDNSQNIDDRAKGNSFVNDEGTNSHDDCSEKVLRDVEAGGNMNESDKVVDFQDIPEGVSMDECRDVNMGFNSYDVGLYASDCKDTIEGIKYNDSVKSKNFDVGDVDSSGDGSKDEDDSQFVTESGNMGKGRNEKRDMSIDDIEDEDVARNVFDNHDVNDTKNDGDSIERDDSKEVNNCGDVAEHTGDNPQKNGNDSQSFVEDRVVDILGNGTTGGNFDENGNEVDVSTVNIDLVAEILGDVDSSSNALRDEDDDAESTELDLVEDASGGTNLDYIEDENYVRDLEHINSISKVVSENVKKEENAKEISQDNERSLGGCECAGDSQDTNEGGGKQSSGDATERKNASDCVFQVPGIPNVVIGVVEAEMYEDDSVNINKSMGADDNPDVHDSQNVDDECLGIKEGINPYDPENAVRAIDNDQAVGKGMDDSGNPNKCGIADEDRHDTGGHNFDGVMDLGSSTFSDDSQDSGNDKNAGDRVNVNVSGDSLGWIGCESRSDSVRDASVFVENSSHVDDGEVVDDREDVDDGKVMNDCRDLNDAAIVTECLDVDDVKDVGGNDRGEGCCSEEDNVKLKEKAIDFHEIIVVPCLSVKGDGEPEGDDAQSSFKGDDGTLTNEQTHSSSITRDTIEICKESRLGVKNGDSGEISPIRDESDTNVVESSTFSHAERLEHASEKAEGTFKESFHTKVKCQKVKTVTDAVLTIQHEETLEGQVLKTLTKSEEVVTTETRVENTS